MKLTDDILPGVRAYIDAKENERERERAIDSFLAGARILADTAYHYSSMGYDLLGRLSGVFFNLGEHAEEVRTEKEYEGYKAKLELIVLADAQEQALRLTNGIPEKGDYVKVVKAGIDVYEYIHGGNIDTLKLGSIGCVDELLHGSLRIVFPVNRKLKRAYSEIIQVRPKIVKAAVECADLKLGDYVQITRTGAGGENYLFGGNTDQMPLGSVGKVFSVESNEVRAKFPLRAWSLTKYEICKVEMEEVGEEERKEQAENRLKETKQKLKETIAKVEGEYEQEHFKQIRKTVFERDLNNLRKAGLEQEEIYQLLADKGLEHMLK